MYKGCPAANWVDRPGFGIWRDAGSGLDVESEVEARPSSDGFVPGG